MEDRAFFFFRSSSALLLASSSSLRAFSSCEGPPDFRAGLRGHPRARSPGGPGAWLPLSRGRALSGGPGPLADPGRWGPQGGREAGGRGFPGRPEGAARTHRQAVLALPLPLGADPLLLGPLCAALLLRPRGEGLSAGGTAPPRGPRPPARPRTHDSVLERDQLLLLLLPRLEVVVNERLQLHEVLVLALLLDVLRGETPSSPALARCDALLGLWTT